MSYTALKGWNFHTEEFESLNSYFNPLKNVNFALHPACTPSQLVLAISKLFSRQYIEDQLQLARFNTASDNAGFITALAHHPSIHPLSLISLQIELREQYDPETEEYHTNPDDLTLYLFTINKDSYEWNSASVEIDLSELTNEEAVDLVIAKLQRDNALDLFNPGDSAYLMNPMNVPIFSGETTLLWQYHFGQVRYRQYLEFEGISSDAERVCTIATIAAEIRPEHRIEVDRDLYNTLKWTTPAQQGDRRRLHRLHSYSTKASSVIGGTLRQANELSDPLYGIELEVSSSLNIPEIVEAPEGTYCFVKQDSSITGTHANMYEIVSIPCTMKVHVKSWAQIFEKVGYSKFDVTKNTNNGMHIHIDMAAFNNASGSPDHLHMKHFCWFMINPINTRFQLEVSERTPESLEKYARIPKFHHPTLPSLFQATLDYTANPFRGIVHFKQDRDNGRTITLECRMFKGIPSLGNIVKNLEYVDSVFDFTRKTCFQSNTINNYFTYLDSTPKNRYSTLKEFISRLNQQEIIDTSSIISLVFGNTDPDKIIAILNKHSIVVSSDTLAIINTLIPGVKFGINKYGKFAVIETNRSRLYDLDIPLQQRLTRFKGKKNVSHPHP